MNEYRSTREEKEREREVELPLLSSESASSAVFESFVSFHKMLDLMLLQLEGRGERGEGRGERSGEWKVEGGVRREGEERRKRSNVPEPSSFLHL